MLRRLLKLFAIITSIGAYLIVLLGVFVTNTGSGKGCGQTWPFCHGEIIPGTLTLQGLVEYSHRIAAGADGFLVIVLTVGSLLLYRRDFRVKLFAALSLLFLLLQGALGALTVVYEGTWELSWLLSFHFGLSLIAFASVLLLTIRLFQIDRTKTQPVSSSLLPQLQYPVLGLIIYTYLVVYSGALVEHTGAVMACGYQIPGCGSTYLPGLASLAGIQVLHRYAAALLWFLVLALLITVMRRYRARSDMAWASWWAFILVTLQAVSGVFNVLTAGQLLAAVIHTTLITLFFTTLCYMCMQIGWPGRSARVSPTVSTTEHTHEPQTIPTKA